MTNYSINKFNSNFEQNEIINDSCSQSHPDEKGHKRSLKWFLQYVKSQNKSDILLWEEIKSIVLKTICSIQPTLKHNYKSLKSTDLWGGGCFEILGFDILISESLKPYILEINSSPSFNTDSDLDKIVKCGLVKDSLKLMDFTNQRKYKIMKEENELLEKRMKQGKRHKMSEQQKLYKKCLFIKAAEQKYIKQNGGGFGEFEKIFGVDEYLSEFEFFEKNKIEYKRNQSLKQNQIKGTLIKHYLSSSKRTYSSSKISKQSEKFSKDITIEKSTNMDQEECLGIKNRKKVFQFMKFAELIEKNNQSSKFIKMDSLILKENILDNNQKLFKIPIEEKNVEPTKLKYSKSFQNNNTNGLTENPQTKLRKLKSCSLLNKSIPIKTSNPASIFKKIFTQHLMKDTFSSLRICPMIKLLFELLKFLLEFKSNVNVRSKLPILNDFRWKRNCYCRLCIHLFSLEKVEDFKFIPLKSLLSFYKYPCQNNLNSTDSIIKNNISNETFNFKIKNMYVSQKSANLIQSII